MLAVLTLAAAIAAAPPAAKHVVVNPSWDRQPTTDELLASYPTDAMAKHVEGKVSMECRVLHDETLTDCKIVKEDPPGQGFGEAALSLQGVIRMHPEVVDGTPTDKGDVIIPLNFKIAAGAPNSAADEQAFYIPQAERCTAFEEAQLETDPRAAADLWVWSNVYAAMQTNRGVKPSEWLARIEAARVDAEKSVATPEGQAALKACHKYADVIMIVNGAKK